MKKPGPKPDVKKDKKVKKLRENGLSFRDIAKVVDEDVKNVYGRYQRTVGKLSTADI